MRFRRFFFLCRVLLLDFPFLLSSEESNSLLLLDFLYLLSSDESYSLDDESDDDGCDSGSSGTYYFPLHYENSVGRVSVLGYSFFVPTGVETKCDVFEFVVLV